MRDPLCQHSCRVVIVSVIVLAYSTICTPGCGTGQRPTLSQTAVPIRSSQAAVNKTLAKLAQQSPSAAADYNIGAQDTLQITLFNIPPSEVGVTPRITDVLVNQNGNISLPLLGDIHVAGMTTSAAEEELRQRYVTYIREPQVGVQVKEYRSQRVSVVGAVNHPGVLSLTGPKTLVDVLALAGGVSEKASGQIHLSRQGQEGYIINLVELTENAAAHNLLVQADDVINVPKAGQFFVYGAINKPGSYSLDRPYRLTQALAVAGGPDDSLAQLSDVTIIRSSTNKEKETLVVNLANAVSATIDPIVEPDDVIVIPTSTTKLVIKRIFDRFSTGLSIPLM
jgi:polysaccharide export outer membrane protein